MKKNFIFMLLSLVLLSAAKDYAQQVKPLSAVYNNYVTALCQLSETHYYNGCIEEAVRIMESNLYLLAQLSPKNKSLLLAQYAKVIYYKNSVQGINNDLPIEKIKEAVSVTEQVNNTDLLGSLHDLMGLALYSKAFITGEFSLALPYYESAYRTRERLKDERGLAETLFHFGLIKDFGEKNKKEAMEFYRRGYRIAEKGEHKVELSYLARHIGVIHLIDAKLDSAEYYLTQSLNLRKEIGLKLFIAPALTVLADVMKQKGDLQKAGFYLNQAVQYAAETKAYRFHASALLALGDLQLAVKDNAAAIKYYKEAKSISEKSGYADGINTAAEKISKLIKL